MWRVTDRATFHTLSKKGWRFRSGPLWINYLPYPQTQQDDPPRLAFSFGRRIGKAVVRNKLRRRVRAIFTQLVKEERLPNGVYLVGMSPVGAQMSYGVLESHVEIVVSKIQKRLM